MGRYAARVDTQPVSLKVEEGMWKGGGATVALSHKRTQTHTIQYKLDRMEFARLQAALEKQGGGGVEKDAGNLRQRIANTTRRTAALTERMERRGKEIADSWRKRESLFMRGGDDGGATVSVSSAARESGAAADEDDESVSIFLYFGPSKERLTQAPPPPPRPATAPPQQRGSSTSAPLSAGTVRPWSLSIGQRLLGPRSSTVSAVREERGSRERGLLLRPHRDAEGKEGRHLRRAARRARAKARGGWIGRSQAMRRTGRPPRRFTCRHPRVECG